MIARDERERLFERLDEVETRVHRIEALVSGERSCLEVLAQIAQVARQLDAAALALLDAHARACVERVLARDETAGDDLIDVVHRYSRLR